MALLGLFVAARFDEANFVPTRKQRWRGPPLSIFRRGLTLAGRDHEVLLVLAATAIINGAGMIAWVFPKQLIRLGLTKDPALWYTALGILASAVGFMALRLAEARIDGIGVARRTYALTCFIGTLGLIVLACAPNALLGGVGVLLVSGISFNVTRAVSVIWVNRRTTSDVRATVLSLLSQAETVGEIGGGFALALLARAAGIPQTLAASGALIACAGLLVARSRADRAS